MWFAAAGGLGCGEDDPGPETAGATSGGTGPRGSDGTTGGPEDGTDALPPGSGTIDPDSGSGGPDPSTTGGDDGSDSTGAPPEMLEPCPADSTIERVSSGEYFSWPGVVASEVAITGNGENHAPKRLEVRVVNDGAPVSECLVHWQADAGDGWGFAANPRTDADGRAYAYWTAGEPGKGTLRARIDLEGGGASEAEFTVETTDRLSRTDSVHLNYALNGAYTEFRIRTTPRSGPPATYYSALNWTDSYAGIQFVEDGQTMVIFSVWDAGGEDAVITDAGACNETLGFGGEGTGTSCRLRLPPSEHGAVPGLPDDYTLSVDATYELHLTSTPSASGGTAHSITFTDVTNAIGPISLGTQTTGTSFAPNGYASSFVEEWVEHGNCLDTRRAVEYHDLSARLNGGAWTPVDAAAFSPNYVTTNNEICANYLAEVRDGRFFVSSGGTLDVGPPYVPGDRNFPKPQPTLELP